MNTTKYFQQPSKFLLNIVQEGDGLELLRDLKDEVTQLVIFDPQYQPFKGLTWDPQGKKEGGSNWGQQKDREAIIYPTIFNNCESISVFLSHFVRILKPNGFIILWISEKILLTKDFYSWIPTNLKVKELLIWIKGNYLGLGQNYFRKGSEYALLIQKKPFQRLATKNRSLSNIFNEIVNWDIRKRSHVHQKPIKMTETIIQQLTQEGDLVVDPCAGSFVSLRACQSLKRNFLGTDLTLRELMKFNINKERSRELLKQESNNYKP